MWWPKSERQRPVDARAHATRFFRHDSFVGYWNTLCKEYDALGEHPFRAGAGAAPTSVPVLAWVGDQDTFDEAAERAHWSALSSNVSFQVMDGWSHDFGPVPNKGFLRAAELVKGFFAQ